MVSHAPAQPPAHLGDTGRMTTCVTCEGLPRAECKYQKCTTKDGFRGGCVWTGSKGCTCLTEKQARMDKGQCLDDDECTNKGQFCYHHVHNQEFLHTQTIGKGKAAGGHWDAGCGKKFAWSKEHPCDTGLKCKRKTSTVWAVVPIVEMVHVCLKPE
ncbi:unnamed protein product [Vitrella brassicaformis CCMP3155]|uniref:Uncharacterized protein n=2 Tax=Vitrella brassicaformis TaxID=1169539 RepID=A0A0G4G4M3_VITBC|nr:unnamed protein product [Vitrella brassicaformis CCMP3155]|eukprot:CEM23217.1 unnamed protein product [Vitrella brassicaformis CCMP3155]